MNIRFEKIDQYIHAYKVEGIHDMLLKYKKEFNDIYMDYMDRRKTEDLYNISLDIPEIQSYLDPIFNSVVKNYYYIDNTWDNYSYSLAIQNNELHHDVYHNHVNSTLTATTYLNPPRVDEGGGLIFFLHEFKRPIIQPQKDYIYFFPSWVLHKPLPQTRKEPRICLNWGYESIQRPIHKLTGDKW